MIPLQTTPPLEKKRVLRRPPVLEDYINVTSSQGTRVFLVLRDDPCRTGLEVRRGLRVGVCSSVASRCVQEGSVLCCVPAAPGFPGLERSQAAALAGSALLLPEGAGGSGGTTSPRPSPALLAPKFLSPSHGLEGCL